MAGDRELVRLPAREVVRLLRRREITPREAVAAAVARIRAVDPLLNAVPTLCEERALARARALERRPPAPDGECGTLAGLPILVKDLTDVAGVRTTYGSPVFADHVPQRSDILVERLEARGAIVLGKTNTPEFGAGANTFNEVFGPTRNPWDPTRTCGGSSGGSAVALATGMAWLATGSDLGGSLRTPAAFCGVVGLRPSPGRVARGPTDDPFDTLAVAGPMARDVGDLALFLDAMAGADPRDPLSLPGEAESFAAAAARPAGPLRLAWSADLGGLTPVDREVAAVCTRALARLEAAGWTVAEAAPDLRGAVETFGVLRGLLFATKWAPLLERHRQRLKPEVVWNIEYGLGLDAATVARARRARARYVAEAAALFARFDLLVTPAAIVPPFDLRQRWLERLGDHVFATYVDWLAVTSAVTLLGCPALALPCGLTAAGLPVGLQLVAPPRAERALLRAAAAMEEAFGFAARLPVDPPAAGGEG